jgi:hypothetical protein
MRFPLSREKRAVLLINSKKLKQACAKHNHSVRHARHVIHINFNSQHINHLNSIHTIFIPLIIKKITHQPCTYLYVPISPKSSNNLTRFAGVPKTSGIINNYLLYEKKFNCNYLQPVCIMLFSFLRSFK